MEEWDLLTVEAPAGTRDPFVVVEDDGARAVLIVLQPGQELGEHQVRENAWIVVVEGTLTCGAPDAEPVEIGRGHLVRWEPGERHTLASPSGARILLVLTPWPAPGHFQTDGRPAARAGRRVGGGGIRPRRERSGADVLSCRDVQVVAAFAGRPVKGPRPPELAGWQGSGGRDPCRPDEGG